MSKTNEKNRLKLKRKLRIRKKVSGTDLRPRLSVFRSAAHVYAQVINDLDGTTMVNASSFEKGNHRRATIGVCFELGKTLAERCKAANVNQIVFDKNGNKYHGRIKALAEGAREGGLQF